MALNPSIILAGRQPDIINTLARSTQAASGVNQVRDQNALRQLYQTQGPGIVAGDQGALNAYAQIDPNAAFGIGQRQQAGRRADQANTRAQATFDAEMSKQQQYEELTRALEVINGAQTPEQWDQAAQQYGANDLVGQFGNKQAILDKLLPFQERLAGEIARAQPPKPGFDIPTGYQLADPNNPQIGVRPLLGYDQGPETTAAIKTLQQRAELAGLKAGTPEYQTFMANGGKAPTGMRLVTNADGSVTFEQGAGVVGDGDTMGMDVSGAPAMISSIDGVLSDPALDWSTGWMQWRQKIPGTDAYRFGTRVDQLNGQAFLQAFQSLKGGGQITEVEGNKATQAIGRLDSAQSADDYRQALQELRDILVLGQSRPKGWTGNREQTAPAVGTIEGGYRFIGGDPANPSSWEIVK